jgi:putative membrane protein
MIMMHNFFYHGWGPGMMGWSWLISLVFLGLLVWVVVKLINQGNANRPQHDSAMHILRERYAKGEIDREEFEDKRKDLQ